MTLTLILLSIIPLLGIILLIPPLFKGGRDVWDVPEARIEALEEKKRMLVHAIRELDFDFGTGKLDVGDHDAQRGTLKEELAEVVGRLKKEEGAGG